MQSKSDFWLTLHKLVRDFELEGSSDDARLGGLIELLETLARPTREAYCADLERTLAILSALAVQYRSNGFHDHSSHSS